MAPHAASSNPLPQRVFDFSTMPPPAAASGNVTRDLTLLHAEAHKAKYRPGFASWLEDNWHIWGRFRAEADAMRRQGRAHYSARTIGEYLRHQTALREADSEFKLNNNQIPDLARLYMALDSTAGGFFELRGRD